MALPSLCHFHGEGIYHISSDPVEVLIGEAWVPAIYTDKGWATADGSTLLTNIQEWQYAAEEGEITKDNLSQHQGRDESRQTTKASDSNRARQSRKK